MKYVLLCFFCLINLVLMATSSTDIQTLKKQAAQGYADAQVALGRHYVNGNGVAKDYSEAVKWFRKAAAQGYAAAQCGLGFCYFEGMGVAKDYSEAVKWFRKAAAQGYADAQYALGLCYYGGMGVAKNYPEAVKWLLKAVEQGNEEAEQFLVEALKSTLICDVRAVYQKRIKAIEQNDCYSYLSTYASYLRKNRYNSICKEFENLVHATRNGLQINVKDIQFEGFDDGIYHFRILVQANHLEKTVAASFIYEEGQLVIFRGSSCD